MLELASNSNQDGKISWQTLISFHQVPHVTASVDCNPWVLSKTQVPWATLPLEEIRMGAGKGNMGRCCGTLI